MAPPWKKSSIRQATKKRPSQPTNWTPRDDFILIYAAQQRTRSLDHVAGRMKFSRHFTERDIKRRWRTLLFDSTSAIDASKKVTPVQSQYTGVAAWTQSEDQILTALHIPSTAVLSDTHFQYILDLHRTQFHYSRTARELALRYHHIFGASLRGTRDLVADGGTDFYTLESQVFSLKGEKNGSKETLDGEELATTCYAEVEQSQQNDMLIMETVHQLENDKRDTKFLALLRGIMLRHPMKTKEIVLGRGTPSNRVDVNLCAESSTSKISRRQAIIKLKCDGEFYICNIGKCVIFINGHPVFTGRKKRLCDDCLIEISSLRFVFESKPFWKKIKSQLF